MTHTSLPPRYTLISPWFDGVFFWSALPILLLMTFLFERYQPEMIHPDYYPIWLFFLVLSVDVSHVWGSLFRILAAPRLTRSYRLLIAGVPIVSFLFLLLLAYISRNDEFFLLFQVLSLIAAYHFIKQQIGVTLLYARRDISESSSLASRLRILDKGAIWISTGIPLAYWISRSSEVDLIWFVEGEFDFLSPFFARFDLLALMGVLGLMIYVLAQIYAVSVERYRPNPLKYLYILMTAFIWGWGIVVYESFVLFGLGVMLLHGVAYHGLVISSVTRHRSSSRWGWIWGVGVLLCVVCFAYIEEFVWDQLVWRERADIFGAFGYTLSVDVILPMIVALLGSIQMSHYLLDRYIWRKEFGPVRR